MVAQWKKKWHKVLYVVYQSYKYQDGVTSSDIAYEFQISLSHASNILRHLHHWGFTTRRNIAPEQGLSGKKYRYYITRKGRDKLHTAVPFWQGR